MLEGVKESIVMSNEKDKLVVVKGLKKYMVISTKDVLLICPRNEKDVKAALADLGANNLIQYQ